LLVLIPSLQSGYERGLKSVFRRKKFLTGFWLNFSLKFRSIPLPEYIGAKRKIKRPEIFPNIFILNGFSGFVNHAGQI